MVGDQLDNLVSLFPPYHKLIRFYSFIWKMSMLTVTLEHKRIKWSFSSQVTVSTSRINLSISLFRFLFLLPHFHISLDLSTYMLILLAANFKAPISVHRSSNQNNTKWRMEWDQKNKKTIITPNIKLTNDSTIFLLLYQQFHFVY